jgi:hypothetical protein
MRWLALGLFVATVLPAPAQEQERLWMPEGYHLLSLEERRDLPPDELKVIHSKNAALLDEALARMTPSERGALGQELQRFGQSHALSDVEKHYIALISMRLLAGAMQEHTQQEKEAEKARFQKLLQEQEEATRGFASDQKSVEAEAWAAYERRGMEDSQKLYLRVLKPLRARPWNDVARFVFEKLVGAGQPFVEVNGEKRPLPPGLPDAALAFCRKRQAETPSEGAWFSLEAFLRLRRGEIAEAKRLFRAAVAKDAKDGDSYVFPLLIAEIEQNAPEIASLRARAQNVWPKANDLDRILFENLAMLPAEIEAKARLTFESRYKQAYPAEWGARAEILGKNLRAGEARKVESETSALLTLPLSVLPEPRRTEIWALNLEANAVLGRCEGLEAQIPVFEAMAEKSFPRESDPHAPPRFRTTADVRTLRGGLEGSRISLERLKALLDEGKLDASDDWARIPAGERRHLAEAFIEELRRQVADGGSLLEGRDDAAAAAEWSRHELEKWEEERHFPGTFEQRTFDISGRAEGLSIAVRHAVGACLLARGDARGAARLLRPCAAGRYHHMHCIEPLVDAGAALARSGDLKEAVAIYKMVSPSFVSTDRLFDAIEKAAPGAVERRASVSKPAQPSENP